MNDDMATLATREAELYAAWQRARADHRANPTKGGFDAAQGRMKEWLNCLNAMESMAR